MNRPVAISAGVLLGLALVVWLNMQNYSILAHGGNEYVTLGWPRMWLELDSASDGTRTWNMNSNAAGSISMSALIAALLGLAGGGLAELYRRHSHPKEDQF